MKRFISASVITVIISIAAIACSSEKRGESTPSPTASTALSGRLVITGSSTVAPLVGEIAKRFEAQHSDVRIDVQTGGSSRGIADAAQGTADLGMASRGLKGEESGLAEHPIALDGISIIVHADNPISQLTDAEIIGIYTGRISNWKDVGGNDAPITVVNKAEGRATLELFVGYFKIKNSDIKASVVIGDNEQGVKTVAGNPNSIGYVSIGTAEYDAKIGVPIKLLPVGSIAPTLENVQNGSFPISRPLILVTKPAPQGLAREFIDYAQSEAVYDIVKEQYFVPIPKR
ncbi:MAG: phosphate ABC transporter substrate-binding protein [Deltaproteobacteria bacterium]